MGDTSGYAHSESEHHGETTSTGKSERAIPVMTPQEFMDLDKGEAVCFSLDHKPFRLKSMNARRHSLLAKRLGMEPPKRLLLPAQIERQQASPPAPKPQPLPSWHFDPQLFRKWPEMLAEGRGAEEVIREQAEEHEVSLGL